MSDLSRRTGRGTLYGFLAFCKRNDLHCVHNEEAGQYDVTMPDGNIIQTQGEALEPVRQAIMARLEALDIVPLD